MDLVNLSESGDLSKYTVSGEWDLVGMPARRSVQIPVYFEFAFVK